MWRWRAGTKEDVQDPLDELIDQHQGIVALHDRGYRSDHQCSDITSTKIRTRECGLQVVSDVISRARKLRNLSFLHASHVSIKGKDQVGFSGGGYRSSGVFLGKSPASSRVSLVSLNMQHLLYYSDEAVCCQLVQSIWYVNPSPLHKCTVKGSSRLYLVQVQRRPECPRVIASNSASYQKDHFNLFQTSIIMQIPTKIKCSFPAVILISSTRLPQIFFFWSRLSKYAVNGYPAIAPSRDRNVFQYCHTQISNRPIPKLGRNSTSSVGW